MFATPLRFLARFPRRQQHSSRPRPRARLRVEALEDRALISVVVGQSGATLNITATIRAATPFSRGIRRSRFRQCRWRLR
jgi:hypothetical protein